MTDWEIHRPTVDRWKVLLCDDDPDFLASFQRELARTFAKLNKTAAINALRSPTEAPPELLDSCDMAFLDIDYESESCNGIDFAGQLRARNPRALIFFVTNYIDYAPAGYEVQAFRYILKRDMETVLGRYLLQAVEALAEGQEQLRLREGDAVTDLPLERISYLEVMDHSVSIHAGENAYTLAATLSSLERELENHGFLRIHKSYLVNMACIRKFRSRECLLADGTALAVSEKNYAQQKQKYLLWKGLK